MGCRVLNLIRDAKIWRRERVVRLGGEEECEGSKRGEESVLWKGWTMDEG